MKACGKCKITKSDSDFGRSKVENDGLQFSCRACAAEYYKANKARIQVQANKRYLAKPEVPKARASAWYQANKPKARQTARLYRQDVGVKLALNLRIRLCQALKRGTRGGSAVRDLGCSIPELKAYLEERFQPGMNWDNWSRKGWHIDHIAPISKFDLADPEEVKKACNFTNLQPLWAYQNHSKGCREHSNV